MIIKIVIDLLDHINQTKELWKTRKLLELDFN